MVGFVVETFTLQPEVALAFILDGQVIVGSVQADTSKMAGLLVAVGAHWPVTTQRY
jgi:hypothetical protein